MNKKFDLKMTFTRSANYKLSEDYNFFEYKKVSEKIDVTFKDIIFSYYSEEELSHHKLYETMIISNELFPEWDDVCYEYIEKNE